jgi:Arc/MetJ-type ribon-helix-helix transcriptional regulator
MEIEITALQHSLIEYAIASGRLSTSQDAAREAFSLWEKREQARKELLALVDEAEASLARGEGLRLDDHGLRNLANDIKRRGRERLQKQAN